MEGDPSEYDSDAQAVALEVSVVERDLIPTVGVPLRYAAAMAAGALAALATGAAYDRLGPQVLLILPFLVAAVPAPAFGGDLGTVVVGLLLRGGIGSRIQRSKPSSPIS